MEVLHLFVKDLLGRDTPAARIFEIKTEEDFERTKVVTKLSQRLAVVGLIAINFFFVYYSILRGYLKGTHWQQVYAIACAAQVVVEIVINETMECIWVNFFVPTLVTDEVRSVVVAISDTITKLCMTTTYNDEDAARYFLNAPDYLFLSTNVAKAYPNLLESMIVLSYNSHLPGEICKKWLVGSIARISRHQRLQNVTLLTGVLMLLQYICIYGIVINQNKKC